MTPRAASALFAIVFTFFPSLAGCSSGPPSNVAAAPVQPERVVSRVAFGSCAREDRPQPVWDAVLAARPDLFVFLGDNVYADTRNIAEMRRKYGRLAAMPGYQRLAATTPVLGTWDDHDYGENDAGAEFPKKAEAQGAFLDFFGVPAESPRRRREGVYHAASFGPADRRVQVILLDTRYFRSPLVKHGRARARYEGPYAANEDPSATVLGEAQWAWLAERLREPAKLRLIASSVQVLPDGNGWEGWSRFPGERRRLLGLIAEAGAGGVVFLSGDRHHGELSVLPAGESGVGYPLYDFTASGLNQSRSVDDEPNALRAEALYPKPHFGLIEVDWGRGVLTLGLRNAGGEPVWSRVVPLSELGVR